MKTKIYYRSSYNYVLATLTGMIGYNINNNSICWGIVDGIFYPFAIIKWIVCEQLTLSLIKQTFPFFFS